MDEDSVWYLFDPNSPGWIKRRLEKDEYVSADDVTRVARHHPECMNDPVIQAHILRLLAGDVRTPRGRPKQSLGRRALIWLAGQMAREQMVEWREGRGGNCPKKGRGEKSISEAAYEKFGTPLGMSGRALANEVSSLKSNPLFGE